jgi:predicted ester cyclase
LQFTVDEMISEGDMVAKRRKAVFTHKGELMGVPPTGKKVTFTGVSFARFANGKLVEEWEAADYLDNI